MMMQYRALITGSVYGGEIDILIMWFVLLCINEKVKWKVDGRYAYGSYQLKSKRKMYSKCGSLVSYTEPFSFFGFSICSNW